MILFECFVDEVLLKFLLKNIAENQFEHKHGKGNVLRWIFELENSLGLIDRDATSMQYRGYYTQFEELDYSNHYKYTVYTIPNGNKIVELDPEIEPWILRVADLKGINPEQYGLSKESNRFKKTVNLNPKKLVPLLNALEDSEHLNKLKQVLLDSLN